MKRTTIWLTEPQLQKLTRLSKETGITVAELIRRFIDQGLKREGK
jgi:predicted DNA-binding protein